MEATDFGQLRDLPRFRPVLAETHPNQNHAALRASLGVTLH
jgi:hypothetical protein